MAATLQRVRKKEKNYSPIPHKWVDMMIPGSLSVTADGQIYCVMDEKIRGKEEMLWGFASKTGIDVMKKSSDWYVDYGWAVSRYDCTDTAVLGLVRLKPINNL